MIHDFSFVGRINEFTANNGVQLNEGFDDFSI
jgi:hypothetical protein